MPACGSDTFTAAASDAALSETSIADSTTTPDSAKNADAATFCMTQTDALLCADFDENDLHIAFTMGRQVDFFIPSATDAGTLTLGTPGESSPACLEAILQQPPTPGVDAGPQSATVSGSFSFDSAPTHFEVEADIRFNSVGNTSDQSGFAILTFELTGGLVPTAYQLTVFNGQVELTEYIGSFQGPMINLGPVPAKGAGWNHLAIAVSNGSGSTLTASLGGPLDAGGFGGTASGGAGPDDNKPAIILGLIPYGVSDSLDVSFDNVILHAGGSAIADAGDDAMDAQHDAD